MAALMCGMMACDPADGPAEWAANKVEPMSENGGSANSERVRSENPAWPLGREMLANSVAKARELNAAIERFLDAPNIENLQQAQHLWREGAVSIENFHLFSRLGTVAPQDFQKIVDLQFNLAAWPIQPGYLDGFGDHPYSGIVFDIGVPMTAEVLREQHGMTDNSDATMGIYAMEFLLFGEQNSRGPLVFQPITALNERYQEDGYSSVEELPRNRRRELLRLQARLLVDDAAHLQDVWTSNQPGTFQHNFELLTPTQQSELLHKAALALATEQLVVIANQRGNELWQGQQLADRLAAQLDGLAQFNSRVNLGEDVAAAIARSLTSLNDIRGLPPLDQQGLSPHVNWQDAYASLRGLIKALNPAPTDPPTSPAPPASASSTSSKQSDS